MSNATDFGLLIKLLVNDTTLKTLMDISSSNQSNYRTLVDKYFLQTYVSDLYTNDGSCRLLIRNGAQYDTNNEYVKFNSVLIEIYVPKTKDFMSGFQTRTNQISDRLIYLLNQTQVNPDNEMKLKFKEFYELASATDHFKRSVMKFEWKKIYR